MNKRARLGRRILRDHRKPVWRSHWSVTHKAPWGVTRGNWYCPHCPLRGLVWEQPQRNKWHVPTYYGGGREQTRQAD